MQEYIVENKRMLRAYLLLGFLNLAGTIVTGKMPLVYGMVFGTLAGIIYFLMMSFRIRKTADLPPDKAVGYMRTGWVVRLLFVTAIFAVSVNHPQLDLWAALTGFFSLHLIILFHAILIALRLKRFDGKRT